MLQKTPRLGRLSKGPPGKFSAQTVQTPPLWSPKGRRKSRAMSALENLYLSLALPCRTGRSRTIPHAKWQVEEAAGKAYLSWGRKSQHYGQTVIRLQWRMV